jgi:cell wall-associated NlpC family hydrolase
MPVTRAQIVAEARTWIGTKYMHQQRMKGVGVDCLGLPIGVARELGIVARDFDVNGYSRQPDGTLEAKLAEALELIPPSALVPGDMALVATHGQANHFAIVGDYRHGGLSLIHAVPPRGVVEHRLDPTWQKRIVATYRPQGVES